MFDFDEGFNNWKSKDTTLVQCDLINGLVRKKDAHPGYFMLLPVPEALSIRNQVVNPANGEHYKGASVLPIELLFHDVPGLGAWFTDDPTRPGHFRRFTGNKIKFASTIVPHLDAQHFECFRPMFEFIKTTLGADAVALAS